MTPEDQRPNLKEAPTAIASTRRIRMWLGICFLPIAVVYLWTASSIDMGERTRPGPGVFPLIVGIGLLIAALVTIFEPVTTESSEQLPADKESRRQVFQFALLIVLYAALLEPLGYLISTVIVILPLARSLHESQNRWRALAVTLVLAVLVDLIFSVLLNVSIPQGVFGIGVSRVL